MHWRRKWQPTPVLLPGESQGRGAWWAVVYGVSQSQTPLKRLSSSSKQWGNFLTRVTIPQKDQFLCCLTQQINNQTLQETKFFPSFSSMHVLASQKNFKKNKRTTERGGEGRDWGRIEEMRPTEYKMRVLPTSFLNSNGQYVLKALKMLPKPMYFHFW